MSIKLVAFDCGAGIVIHPGETAQDVIEAHSDCELCIHARIERLEVQIEELRQRAHRISQERWQAKVDAALAEARRTA